MIVGKMSGTNPMFQDGSQQNHSGGYNNNNSGGYNNNNSGGYGTGGGAYNNSWSNRPPPFKAFENAVVDMRRQRCMVDSAGKHVKLSLDPDLEMFAVATSVKGSYDSLREKRSVLLHVRCTEHYSHALYMRDILEQILHINMQPDQFVRFVNGIRTLYESLGLRPESVEEFIAVNKHDGIASHYAGLHGHCRRDEPRGAEVRHNWDGDMRGFRVGDVHASHGSGARSHDPVDAFRAAVYGRDNAARSQQPAQPFLRDNLFNTPGRDVQNGFHHAGFEGHAAGRPAARFDIADAPPPRSMAA